MLDNNNITTFLQLSLREKAEKSLHDAYFPNKRWEMQDRNREIHRLPISAGNAAETVTVW